MNKRDKLNEVIENAKEMILAGVLLKNVKKHFTNLGLDSNLADKICKIAELEANEWQTKKAVL